MAGRPRVRTVGVAGGVVEGMRDVCGSASQAYRALGLADRISFDNFQRAFKGQTVTPGDAWAIEGAWRGMVERLFATHGRSLPGEPEAVRAPVSLQVVS